MRAKTVSCRGASHDKSRRNSFPINVNVCKNQVWDFFGFLATYELKSSRYKLCHAPHWFVELKRYVYIYTYDRIKWWSGRIIISPLDLSFMHIIWFKSIYNHMKENNREEWFLLKKKCMVWVGECLRVRSCLYALVFVHELLYAYFACVSNNICFMCLHVLSLDYRIENLPIYSSIAVMYGSYSSATSSQEGQFVLCKKTILRIFLFFPLRTVSANLLQSWRTSTILEYWRAMSSSKPTRALKNWNKEMTCY